MKYDEIEYAECVNNPEYYIANYGLLKLANRRKRSIDLLQNQKRMLKDILSHSKLSINSPRCSGATTLLVGYASWRAIFTPNTSIALVVNCDNELRRVSNLVMDYVYSPPHNPLAAAGSQSVLASMMTLGRIALLNGSKIFISSRSSKYHGRGFGINELIVDIVDPSLNLNSIWEKYLPCMTQDDKSKIVLSSSFDEYTHSSWKTKLPHPFDQLTPKTQPDKIEPKSMFLNWCNKLIKS